MEGGGGGGKAGGGGGMEEKEEKEGSTRVDGLRLHLYFICLVLSGADGRNFEKKLAPKLKVPC